MKASQRRTCFLTAAAMCSLIGASAVPNLVYAASGSWLGTADATWANASNWSTTPVPGTGDTATFNGAGNGNIAINLGGGVTINTVLFDTSSAASYIIGTGAVGSQTLTLDNGGAITVNSTVTNNETVNAAL